MKNRLTFIRKNIIITVLALITSMVLSVAVIAVTDSSMGGLNKKAKLVKNCANFQLPVSLRKDTVLDAQNGMLVVTWNDDGQEKTIELPYEPASDFSGCSQDAKNILNHAKQVHEKRINDLCISFTEIIAGKRPLAPKGGRMPNIQGAINFVTKYCK